MSLWPFLALALSAAAGYLLMIRPRAPRSRWVRCDTCGQRAPHWRMVGPICRGCVIDAPPVAVLTPEPPAPGRIVDVRSDPRRASFWRDVRARESLAGDTPDADRMLRRLYPEE